RAPAAENMAPPPAMAMTTTARAARTRPVRSAQRASPLTALTTPIVTAPSGRGEGGYLTAGGGAVTPPDSALLAGPLVAADLHARLGGDGRDQLERAGGAVGREDALTAAKGGGLEHQIAP